MDNNKLTLILTATIDPRGMHFLKRNNVNDRLNDYKKSFSFWCNRKDLKNIIFIENSGYDLDYFKKYAEEIKDKKIEIISSNINDTYDKKLGKGYGEHLCYQEIIKNSKILKDAEHFIIVTGRHIISNFEKIYQEFIFSKSDICLNLIDNLKFADANIYYGTLNFFKNYVIPETANINDTAGKWLEHCVADATLKATAEGMKFKQLATHPDVIGFIGTNNKVRKIRYIKKIRLFFFGILKRYFISHKKY